MRHHFDYKEFRDEIGFPGMIRHCLEEDLGFDTPFPQPPSH
jgi:hypothetical protein